jgi:N-acetylmuramoyl-L-alanine amidase
VDGTSRSGSGRRLAAAVALAGLVVACSGAAGGAPHASASSARTPDSSPRRAPAATSSPAPARTPDFSPRPAPAAASSAVPPAPAGSAFASAPGTLAGQTVVIDPGHNGGNAAAAAVIGRKVNAGGFEKECDTTGTEANDGYPEYAFTLDVATRAAALLRQQGATVVLTRTDSRGVGPCIDQRAAIGNAARAAAAISIHADGGPAGGFGFHVIEPALAPDGGNAAIIGPSSRLALLVRSAFSQTTQEPYANYIATQGLIARNDLGGLNLSRIPKVFIECANMRNASDARHVEDPAWRALAADGIARGITDYLRATPGH